MWYMTHDAYDVLILNGIFNSLSTDIIPSILRIVLSNVWKPFAMYYWIKHYNTYIDNLTWTDDIGTHTSNITKKKLFRSYGLLNCVTFCYVINQITYKAAMLFHNRYVRHTMLWKHFACAYLQKYYFKVVSVSFSRSTLV